MVALPKLPSAMTVAAFLGWTPPDRRRWHLVDGVPLAMAPPSRTHGTLQGELGAVIRNHLHASRGPCVLVVAPGIVPRIAGRENLRIPDLAVTCTPYTAEESVLAEPVLVIELLSPSNQAITRDNARAYTTIPSVREILLLGTEAIFAEILRRAPGGTWPDAPQRITAGMLAMESIGLAVPLADLYADTILARR